MYSRVFSSNRRVLICMLLALGALGLGQLLGLSGSSGAETVSEAASPVSFVTGTVIRRETVVYAPEPGLWQSVPQWGQQVAKGQTLFTLGSSTEAATLARKLKQAQLGLSYAAMALPQRRAAIHQTIAALSQGAADSSTLSALLLGEGAAGTETAAALEAALAALPVTAQTRIAADEAGIFVPVVDGLETLLTPETPVLSQALLPGKPVSELALGRLITGDTWYLSVCLPCSVALGDTLRVELLSGIFQSCTLTVLETSEAGWALLSCRELQAEVAPLREITVKILSE